MAASNRYYVSDWNAGQSYLTTFAATNLIAQADGSYDFVLSESPVGFDRPMLGSEMQSNAASTTGTWNWLAQAPDMVDGAIFGMFLYQDDYRTQPWREYDFEFVGENTSQVRLAVHFENASGDHVTLKTPSIIELGFDASESYHLYSVTVTMTDATFLIDGMPVATFDASHVEDNVWDAGPLASVMDIWAAPPEIAPWAGTWEYPGRSLVGSIDSITLPTDSTRLGDNRNNALTGTAVSDVLYGNAGNDTLDGKGGSDQMFGGVGNDTYVVDSAQDMIREYANAGTDTVRASASLTLSSNVENLTLLTSSALNGFGNELNNILTGNPGANRLEGADGADKISGNAGNDLLFGGSGADSLIGGTGADTLEGGSGHDMFVFVAGSGADTVTDFVAGGTEDVLKIDSFAKASELRQVGSDTLVVLSATDSILLKGVAATSLTDADFRFGLSVQSSANSTMGTEGADKLNGTSLADKIQGLGGNDVIDGKAGSDTMVGGAGNDAMWVSGTGDRTIEAAGGGRDTVHSTISWTLGANIENLCLRSSAVINGTGNELANRITGNNSNNTINGAAGHDTLLGNGGADRLVGSLGADVLTGGAGNDVFVFRTGHGADRITDFTAGGGEDRLLISGYTSYDELRQVGDDTLVILSQTDRILLEDVSASSLTNSDFAFLGG